MPSNNETEPTQIFRNASTNWGEPVIEYLNRNWNLSLPKFLFSHLNLSFIDIGTGLRKIQGDIPIVFYTCLLYTSPSPRDYGTSRMPSSA